MSGINNKSAGIGGDVTKKNSLKSCIQRKLTAQVSTEKKTSRVLVSREYEWLATVIERCSLFFFLLLFLFLALGINAIGLAHWMRHGSKQVVWAHYDDAAHM
jgi:hypothetical protein